MALEQQHEADDDIVFVNIHAVAEAHNRNTFEAAVKKARGAGSTAAVLEDARIDGMARSEIWRLYRPRWSPWTIVVGKKGALLYNGDTPTKQALGEILRRALGRKRKR